MSSGLSPEVPGSSEGICLDASLCLPISGARAVLASFPLVIMFWYGGRTKWTFLAIFEAYQILGIKRWALRYTIDNIPCGSQDCEVCVL